MIVNVAIMRCVGKCEKVKLQLKEYNLKSNMFVIEMGSCDVVLGEKILRTLGPITMDFHKLYMRLNKCVLKCTLKGLRSNASKTISSHCMDKLLNKGHFDIIFKCSAI
jgi:hypothetical protein